ncbi:hypothetical protein BBP40_002017 [Aspergillus hancockii]|nr:hypothetical protein BBP40_002017 [Aspergillus hancockii]
MGCKLLSMSEGNVLHFEQGVEQGFDLVVGADGAWSRVRQYLTPDQVSYCDIYGHVFSILDTGNTAPKVAELVNRGSLYAYSDGKALVGQQLGDGSIQVFIWMTASQDDDALSSADDETLRRRYHPKFSGWAPELLERLVGDAAHLMPPFAGECVNRALEGAMNLADATRGFISRQNATIDRTLREYEKYAFERARRGQELSVGVVARHVLYAWGASNDD